jgi:NAD(P)-dependent dehydrogenase (short-subunit alcohol dehydrogenase family)
VLDFEISREALMSVLLRNATVVVVGGTSGIGLEVARVASTSGASVTAVGRSEAHARTAREILGSGVSVHTLNMGDEPAVRSFFENMTSVDHLVITAGRVGFGKVIETDMAAVRSIFDDRFWGAYHVVRYAAPLMPPTGSITLFSGNLAVKPFAGASVVSAAVAAVEAFGRALAVELKPIRVNTVRSGAVDTPLFRNRPDYDDLLERLSATLPVGRIGTPGDLAHAVLFLMTNAYTTGTVLQIDGGSLIA